MIRTHKKRGMALLIAVIATSALLLASIAISDIAFKQQLISYSGRESKIAFYAADAGLECALFHDLKVENFFPTPGTVPLNQVDGLNCDENENFSAYEPPDDSDIDGNSAVTSRFSYNLDSEFCIIVDVAKIDDASAGIKTRITSRGYNTHCTFDDGVPGGDDIPGGVPAITPGPRNVERALEVTY